MTFNWVPTVFGFLGVVVGAGVGYLILYLLERLRAATADRDARTALRDAKKEAEHILKEAKIHARDEIVKAREAFEAESRSRKQELLQVEERMAQRESNLDRKVAMLDRKEQLLDERIRETEALKGTLEKRQNELNHLVAEEHAAIQRAADLSKEEARKRMMANLQDELRFEIGLQIRHSQEEAKQTAERKAREIVTAAIERYAADVTGQITTTAVALPNDEMKGRLIGKEGRNIRALEAETGVNFLIDDTPGSIVISGFDPLRREVARMALERLIADGRIHPARIEDEVAKARQEIDEAVRAAGEDAVYRLGLPKVAPELVKVLGRLKFRHSFSQNVLQHSVETAQLMGLMAAELGLDTAIAKRVGLFHDIGKALDHEVEGGHATIGAELLRRHGEAAVVCNAVGAHHGDIEADSLYAALAAAADAITAARPGARSETGEVYLKRLEKIEAIANGFRGVTKTFAMQAGREVRVFVEPSHVDDEGSMRLARDIAKQIEREVKFPGQIKVVVVRETRCIEYAR